MKENIVIITSLFGIFIFFFLLCFIILSFVPDEIKYKKCIRTELRYSNLYCVTEDE